MKKQNGFRRYNMIFISLFINKANIMIKTGSKEDESRFFFYGNEEHENESGDSVLLSLGPIEINKLMLVVGIILGILITCGLAVTVIPGLTNMPLWL